MSLGTNRPPSACCSRLVVACYEVPCRIIDGDAQMEGAWPGNDTIPRTTLDINNAFYFYDPDRDCLSSEPVRAALHIVDGVVAGEGSGPLSPSPEADPGWSWAAGIRYRSMHVLAA